MSRDAVALYFDEINAALRRDQASAFLDVVVSHAVNIWKAESEKRATTVDEQDPYYIIHVVRWRQETDSTKPQTVDKQKWYVHHGGSWSDQDFAERRRIYGAKQVRFVYVHLNRRDDFNYSVTYNLEVTRKTPAFLAHLGVIGGLFGMPTRAGGAAEIGAYWGAHQFEFDAIPSDLKLTPVYELLTASCVLASPAAAESAATDAGGGSAGSSFAPVPGQPMPGAAGGGFAPAPGQPVPGAPAAFPPGTGSPAPAFSFRKSGEQVSGLEPQTFDNEGRYFFDFSVGVPLTKIRDLQFTPGRDGLEAANVDQQNIFAFFNLYPRPIDVKRNAFIRWPHLVTGTKIGSQPLRKIVIAAGWGPVLANFYVGLLLNTKLLPATSSCGGSSDPAPAGTPLRNKTCPEFTFGINLPVGAVASALRK
jgi:hypothetical protein